MHARAETIFDLLERAGPSREGAFRVEDGAFALDAAELGRRLRARARGLVAQGVRRGDRVLLSAANSADWVAWFFAILRAGAIAAPVNPGATPRERRTVAELVAPAGVIADDPAQWRGIARVLHDAPVDGGSDPAASGAGLPPLAAGDPALILFTSGTTGRPKAAVQTHATLVYAGEGTAAWLGLGATDVLLACLPLFHANGIYYSMMGALAAGARLHVASRFSVSGFWPMVRDAGATEANLLGPMLAMLLRQPARADDADNPLRLVYTAAAPVQVARDFAARFGVEVLEGYGMTETPYGCVNPLGAGMPGSIGRARQHPGHAFVNEVAIADERGAPLPDRAVGEIVIRNGATLAGYWNDPAATAAALRDGWLRTGDIGYRDEDGYFYIVGRAKEIIRRKGVNIAPAEIEALLREIAGVEEAALIGIPSDLGEEAAIAVVVVAAGLARAGLEDALLAQIRALVSREKCPDEIVVVDALPKTATHRVEKGLLKEWLIKSRADASARVPR